MKFDQRLILACVACLLGMTTQAHELPAALKHVRGLQQASRYSQYTGEIVVVLSGGESVMHLRTEQPNGWWILLGADRAGLEDGDVVVLNARVVSDDTLAAAGPIRMVSSNGGGNSNPSPQDDPSPPPPKRVSPPPRTRPARPDSPDAPRKPPPRRSPPPPVRVSKPPRPNKSPSRPATPDSPDSPDAPRPSNGGSSSNSAFQGLGWYTQQASAYTNPWATDVSDAYELKSITFIMNICGRGNDMGARDLSKKWFGYGGSAPTLQEYWTQCTYGQVVMRRESSIIVEPPALPCSGRRALTGEAWSASQCDNEIWAWLEYAEDWAEKSGIPLSNYPFRIVVLPPNGPCKWSGMGMQGCVKALPYGGRCAVWLNGAMSGYSLDAAMHELGHNLNLQHASANGNEYGDMSCIMGLTAGLRCYNAPNSWAAGWATPVSGGDLVGTGSGAITSGRWTTFKLPAQTTTSANMLRVARPGSASPNGAMFVSYRVRVGYDVNLLDQYSSTVEVHQYDGEMTTGSTQKPQLLSLMKPGDQFRRSGFNVVVSVLSTTGNTATVAVCRYIANANNECPGSGGGVVPVCNRNGVCDAAAGETTTNCAADCPKVSRLPRCGDGVCSASAGENCITCRADCIVDMDQGYCCGGGLMGDGCRSDICNFGSTRYCRA